MMIKHDPPAIDEAEISLFGPGRGECIVIHIGNNRWIVVDSCTDIRSKEPIAFDYFGSLCLEPRNVIESLIITHWHDDHIRGADEIVKNCANSKIYISHVLFSEHFQKFADIVAKRSLAQAPGTSVFDSIFTELRSRKNAGRYQLDQLSFVNEGYRILNEPTIEIQALSPSQAALQKSITEIKDKLGLVGKTKRKAVAADINETSVVLWVRIGSVIILLGADLEYGENQGLGWQAVVTSVNRPDGLAHIVKVPHHGSLGAYHPGMWNNLTINNVASIVTPFSGMRKALPTPEGINAIKNHTNNLYCTTRINGWPPKKLAGAAGKLTAPHNRRRVEGKMGHICVRFPITMVPGIPIVTYTNDCQIL